ncbi:hypothetical protein CVT24_011924 [Panaeolus cyanescens]|uniref:peptidylprolyl isomerase n=1 Tax=Panaeolus cyanescens TaxID=181874 RepID=A0A409VXU4_9AGAR|nr:hypothetical protein CVT24_011924 [Panaeolus cyanescens]
MGNSSSKSKQPEQTRAAPAAPAAAPVQAHGGDNVVQLAEGVTMQTLSPGDGVNFPKAGDNVRIHYVGTLLDGSKFDSSRDRNRPFETKIGMGKVIKGWDIGVPQLSIGQKAILTIASDKAAVNSRERDRGRQVTKSQAIAIPTAPQSPFNHYQTAQMQPGTVRNNRHLPSTSDLYVEPSTHQPYPPARAGAPSAPRGRQQPISNARHQQQVSRYQEAYTASQQPLAMPPSLAGKPQFVREVVQSSIPIALGKAMLPEGMDEDTKALLLGPEKEDVLSEPVPVTIYWRGGGRDVVLARAGDDDWKGRQPMDRESPTSSVWSTTVYLRPGTHHVRFLVDGSWRVAEDLPTAVDDQGSLANYVAVPLTFGSASSTSGPLQAPPPVQRKTKIPGQSFWSADSADGENDAKPDPRPIAHGHAPSQAYTQAKWTSELPPELIEAAAEEEAYLAASAGQFEQATGNMRVTGFVPAPNIPPAPSLPRHLDKLILNTKITERPGLHNGTSSPGASTSGSAVGSGQGGRKERKERDKERERERDRQRARRPNIPPPPPPSEIGGDEDDRAPPPSPGLPTQPEETPTSSTTTSTATPTPHASVPATPTAPLSPTQTPPQWQTPTASSSNPSVSVLNSTSPTIMGTSSLPSASISTPTIPSDRIMPSASRIITIDTANMPAHTDDASVLPVPSHVVLHHLSTSAIKNGVLAVGNTTRYREKVLFFSAYMRVII